MIDLNLLDPAAPEEQVAAMCERAQSYRLGCATVRPSDVQLASKWLGGIVCGAPIGGEHTTSTKLYEIRDLLATAGVQRVVRLGNCHMGSAGNPHDGMFPLHRFMNWVVDDDA